MGNNYKEQLAKIEAELVKWLPGFHGNGGDFSRDICVHSIWTEEEKPVNVNKITDESLKVLFAPGADILSRGGKRWRPLLMTLVCESLGGGDAALPLTPLIEFAHNASLVHDDIEDDSDERRGKPAVHKIYGIDTAINSGSFLFFLSLSCIETYAGDKAQIYKLWAKYIRALHLGQAMDISWHRKVSFIPAIDEYFAMCALKTGTLARMSAEIGAYCAGVSGEVARNFGEAAEKLGLGFQILDDVKNLTSGIAGKKRGDDIVEGKKSLPVLLFLTKHPEKRERVYRCFHDAKINGVAVPEVEELISLLGKAGALQEAENMACGLLEEARKKFAALTGSKSSQLLGLIDALC